MVQQVFLVAQTYPTRVCVWLLHEGGAATARMLTALFVGPAWTLASPGSTTTGAVATASLLP